MFCTNCGNNLGVTDNFCGKCGKAARSQPIPKTDAPMPRVERPASFEPVVDTAPKYSPTITPSRSKTTELKAEKKREELRAELKQIMEKDRGREVTDAELFEADNWFRGYASLMLDLGIKEAQRQERLKKNPEGFHLEGEGYTCFICGGSASKEQSWFDKYGIKCMTCQDAINKKIIPATAASNKDSWYSPLDFEHSFFINRFGLRRFIKEGLLKPRIVPAASGHAHYRLFFIKDHKDILPPKELTKWPMVKFQKDGQEYYHSEPWIYHSNPLEVLKDYKILDYMKTLKEHEVEKSYGSLSFQLSPGAAAFYKINHIASKESPEKKE